jgi:glycosyltransferase involved in cell wall biosynthesis
MSKKTVLHVITGLSTGGAETMLFKYLSNTERKKLTHKVVVLTTWGNVADKIQDLGFEIKVLNMKGVGSSILAVFKLALIIYRFKPDVVQSWMYHSDLFAGVIAKMLRVKLIVWNIRNSSLSERSSKFSTRVIRKICAKISKSVPDLIISCAVSSAKLHQKIGYDNKKIKIIPNGFDPDVFFPSKINRKKIRQEINIDKETIVISLLARFDSQKDHKNFIRAAAIFKNKFKDVIFILCGIDIDFKNQDLLQWIKDFNLLNNVRLLGKRDDIQDIINASDIVCSSSSFGEAFPNIIGEALLCETLCVVTDVGDSKKIINKTGVTVPPNDSTELYKGWEILSNMEKNEMQKLGIFGRRDIIENYHIRKITSEYDRVYLSSN